MTEPNTDLPRLAPGTYLLTKRVVVKEDGFSEFVDEPEGEYIKGFWPRTRTRVTPVPPEAGHAAHDVDPVEAWGRHVNETRGLSHALLLKGYRGFADQVDAMAKRIRQLEAEITHLRAHTPPCTVCGEPGWRGTDRCNLHAPIAGNVEVRRPEADRG